MIGHRFTTHRHAELVSASIAPQSQAVRVEKWTLKQVQGDEMVICFKGIVG